MAKSKASPVEQLNAYIDNLPDPIRPAINYLREIMLSISPEIKEHIKWNSPAFYYSGEMKDFDPKSYQRDILVTNLRKNQIMCVLPTGSMIKQNTQLLEGDYTDGRRMINFRDIDDIKAKEADLRNTIQEWLSLIDK